MERVLSFVNKTKEGVEVLSLLPHQRFVALYLDPLSPYRGLLLYHGLVRVKRVPIAVAQFRSNLCGAVPASLRKIEQEVIKCG
jgi:hypothetical protein